MIRGEMYLRYQKDKDEIVCRGVNSVERSKRFSVFLRITRELRYERETLIVIELELQQFKRYLPLQNPSGNLFRESRVPKGVFVAELRRSV